jgi:hypothetical protein
MITRLRLFSVAGSVCLGLAVVLINFEVLSNNSSVFFSVVVMTVAFFRLLELPNFVVSMESQAEGVSAIGIYGGLSIIACVLASGAVYSGINQSVVWSLGLSVVAIFFIIASSLLSTVSANFIRATSDHYEQPLAQNNWLSTIAELEISSDDKTVREALVDLSESVRYGAFRHNANLHIDKEITDSLHHMRRLVDKGEAEGIISEVSRVKRLVLNRSNQMSSGGL